MKGEGLNYLWPLIVKYLGWSLFIISHTFFVKRELCCVQIHFCVIFLNIILLLFLLVIWLVQFWLWVINMYIYIVLGWDFYVLTKTCRKQKRKWIHTVLCPLMSKVVFFSSPWRKKKSCGAATLLNFRCLLVLFAENKISENSSDCSRVLLIKRKYNSHIILRRLVKLSALRKGRRLISLFFCWWPLLMMASIVVSESR